MSAKDLNHESRSVERSEATVSRRFTILQRP